MSINLYSQHLENYLSMFRIVDDRHTLLSDISSIGSIADSYKKELGFWSRQMLCDAINRNRLIAAITTGSGKPTTLGFLIYSGVHPSSKIQAIAVLKDYARKGIGQALLDDAINRLEVEHFISVCAKPAEDLISAQAFYEKNKFEIIRTEQGGKTLNRQIIVRERTLNVPTLFDKIDINQNAVSLLAVESKQNRLWVIDINALSDILKLDCDEYQKIYDVFSATSAGRINIAVTSESKRELQQNIEEVGGNPILERASALPVISVAEEGRISEKAKDVHDLIFYNDCLKQTESSRSMSGCSRIAECILGNATVFITNDESLISSRRKIREHFGLDVVSLDDFHDALLSYDVTSDTTDITAEKFRITTGNLKDAMQLINKTKSKLYFSKFISSSLATNETTILMAFNEAGNAIGLLTFQKPLNLGESHKITLVVDHQEEVAEIVADALMGKGLGALAHKGPHLVELVEIPGQLLVRRAAYQLGFKSFVKNGLTKLVFGSPITPGNISNQIEKLRLLVGRNLAERLLPTSMDEMDDLFKNSVDKFEYLEKFVSPCLLASNHREIVIQPIKRRFATELLGTPGPMNLFKQHGGAYRTEKIYVCSSNKKNFFRPNQIIMFYESKSSDGCGAIVAAGNVVGVLVQNKKDVSYEQMGRTVLDKVDDLSLSKQVTLVRFNSLMRFPKPVSFKTLKSLGVDTSLSFVSATEVTTVVGQKILDKGWSNV